MRSFIYGANTKIEKFFRKQIKKAFFILTKINKINKNDFT